MAEHKHHHHHHNHNTIDQPLKHSLEVSDTSKLKSARHDIEQSSPLQSDLNMSKSNITAADTNKMEYAVTQLQRAVRTIINEAPDLEQLNQHVKDLEFQLHNGNDDVTSKRDIAVEVLTMARNQKVQLACKLKTLYMEHKLDIFKQVAEFDENTELCDTVPVRLELKKMPQNKEMGKPSSSETYKMKYKEVNSAVDGKKLPAIPLIEDKAIETRVFTHKSVVNNMLHLNEEDLLHSHNERLEFIGDAVLELAVTRILFDRFPNANEGEMSTIRISFVNNAQLFKYSKQYGFDKKLLRNFDDTSSFKQGKQKPLADVFEAYLGGLYVSSGYSNFDGIKDWLSKIMEEKLQWIEKMKITGSKEFINKNAKAELYALIGSAAHHPEYVTLDQGSGVKSTYKVECRMGDEVIGSGEAKGIKEAGLLAAMDALTNRTAVSKYSLLRKATPREESVIAPNTSNSNKTKNNSEPIIQLPVEADAKDLDADPKKGMPWKEELYSYLGQRMSLPTYKTETDPAGKGIKAYLYINSMPACFCTAKNGKIASQACARHVLEHKDVLKACYVTL